MMSYICYVIERKVLQKKDPKNFMVPELVLYAQYIGIRCGHVVRDFESEAKTR